MRFKKIKKLGFKGGRTSVFVVNWVSPCLSFFFGASTVAAHIFTAPTCKDTIIRLEPCALNADFQRFIPRFNKISLLYRHPWKKGLGWKEAQRQVPLQIILVFTLTCPKTFTQGHVSVFDKYLHWPCASVKKTLSTATG